MYTRIAKISNKNANAMEKPRQGEGAKLPRRPLKPRVPPLARTKKTATPQAITASVSSQAVINCHAGSVNR